MAKWKQSLMQGAMKAMQNPNVQKVMSNEKVQKGFAAAFKASYDLKTGIDDKKAEFAAKFDLATKDDLRTMKRELDRLKRQVTKLEKEKDAPKPKAKK